MILLPIDYEKGFFCCFCGREKRADEEFYYNKGWLMHRFTCGHERLCECHECSEVDDRLVKCSVCGCGEEYC